MPGESTIVPADRLVGHQLSPSRRIKCEELCEQSCQALDPLGSRNREIPSFVDDVDWPAPRELANASSGKTLAASTVYRYHNDSQHPES